MQEELELRGVTRTSRGRRVLDDVSFTVRPGRVTGVTGADGAGTTTALRVAVGVLAPSAGEVTWGGNPVTVEHRRRFGYLPQERGLHPRMTAVDHVAFLGEVHGMRPGRARARAEELLDRLGLGPRAGEDVRALRPGEQHRVQVAATLVHDPALLVLDEPFSGLDPADVDDLVTLLRERAQSGVPVLLGSSRPDLVEQLCDDVVVLRAGRVLTAGELEQVRAGRARRYRLVVEPHEPARAVEGAPSGVASFLEQVPGVTLHAQDGPVVLVDLADDAELGALLLAAVRHGHVQELVAVRSPLVEPVGEVAP